MMNNSRKGIVPIFIVGIILLIVIVIYLVIQINPFGAFNSIKSIVNFWLMLGFWILIQAGLIFLYVEIGKFAYKGYKWFRKNFSSASLKLEKFIITHS